MSDVEENNIHFFVSKIYIFCSIIPNLVNIKQKERVILSVSEISIPGFNLIIALRPMAMQT